MKNKILRYLVLIGIIFSCTELQAKVYSKTEYGIKYITDGYFKEAYATCYNDIIKPSIEIQSMVSF